jgi:hypothetical protein
MKKIAFCVLLLISVSPWIAHSGDYDDVNQVKTPNAMIIFDTSSSMENQPNGLSQAAGEMCLKNDGSAVAVAVVGGKCSTGYTKIKFDSGSNHPNSKLYQAKKALNEIITSVVKDQVNLGFSTYAQLKTEKRRGKYQYTRNAYTSKKYWAYYKSKNSYNSVSLQSNLFVDVWGITRTNMGKNSTFFYATKVYNSGLTFPPHPATSGANKLIDLKYTVSSVVYEPENNWYRFYYASDPFDWYAETTFTVDPCTTCSTDTAGNPFPATKTSGTDAFGAAVTWKTYFSGDAEYQTPTGGRAATFWKCVPTTAADTTTWSDTTGTSCDATKTSGGYTYTLIGGTCYDISDYYYPADGSTNKPHTWGYFKVNSSKWPNNSQTPNYYPSKDTASNVNNTPGTYNNHFFFVNFPDDKDAGFKESDRTANMTLVKSFLDLTPVLNPYSSAYWTKLPVHSTFGKTGLTSNTTASVYTPLADSLAASYRYFNDYIYNYNGGDSSSQEKYGETLCRGNYVILLTDGLESCRFNGQTPDYSAASTEAANLLGINVKTFVIGFGTDLTGNVTLNSIASSGGTEKAYFAANFDELTGALRSIFQIITGQYYGRSNPVITRGRDRLFRGNFDIKDGAWRGHLMAWDADKMTGVLAPSFVWDAGEVMNTAGRGKAYTWIENSPDPTLIEFKENESSLYPFVNPYNEDINGDTFVNTNDAKAVINYTLDPNYNDGSHGAGYYDGKRAADWKLGDIYHSTPVVIGEPAFFFTEHNYADFYNQHKDREVLIYVGTNEGMLHAFKNSDGSEKFSIIPKNLLGKVKKLKGVHEFYVDSSPKAYDAYFKGKLKWQTVLVTGQRGGGPYYFAVNVNDPADPKIIWEWTHSSLGDTWGKPEMGRVKVGTDTKYLVFLTGGYSSTDNQGNSFHIVDVEDGTVVKSFTGIGSIDDKIPAGATAYDKDNDGYVDYIYFGDTKGTLWKVDVTSTNPNDWALSEFFKPSSAPKRMPIFYPPAVVKNDLGKILVYIGTGNEMNLMNPSSQNYFYEIEDQGSTGKENWSKTLESGEKVLASPAVSNWVVYFTSWVYKLDGGFCGAGEGRLWGLKVSSSTQTGGTAGLVTLDTQTGKWKDPVNYISLGAGIPTAPVVTNGMVYISSSLNANKVIQVPVPPMATAKIKSWREVTK